MNTHEQDMRLELANIQIQTMEMNQIETLLTQHENRYLNFKNERNTLAIAYSVYNLGPTDPISTYTIQEQCCRKKRLMNEIRFRCKELGVTGEGTIDYDGNEYALGLRVERLVEHYNDAYETLLYHARVLSRINEPMQVPPRLDADGSTHRYSTMDESDEKKSSWQDLILYLLGELKHRRYKRYREQCFREIKTSSGKSTRAWEPVCDISKFVYSTTQKEDKYDMWKHLTNKGSTVRDTVSFLCTTMDVQFPDIEKNRTVWSFQNGIFIGKYLENEKYVSRFIEYDSDEYDRLDPTIVACKYFDMHFDNTPVNDWYDIPTPHMQSIMDYQRFPEDVCRWLYVFCGRLCYDVNDLDGWQVIPFLKGIAGTGKSTIIKVCKKFYDPDDVKTLSNNIEKKFGLDSIHDGFMFISPEIKGDMALEQAEFQSLVSGEDMSIARKNLKAKSLTWKVPGILAGNEMPGWKDNSGSILRRILVWAFPRQVEDSKTDPQLENKLEAEVPMILHKCVRAYLEYSNKHKSQDIWNVVPAYFKGIRNQVAMVTSVLQNFLSSEKVVFGKDCAVPQKLFVHTLKQHCQDNNLGQPRFTPDFYQCAFAARELEVRIVSQVHNGRSFINQPFIFGIDIVSEESQPDFSTSTYQE